MDEQHAEPARPNQEEEERRKKIMKFLLHPIELESTENNYDSSLTKRGPKSLKGTRLEGNVLIEFLPTGPCRVRYIHE